MKKQIRNWQILGLLLLCTVSGFLMTDSAIGRNHVVHAAGTVQLNVAVYSITTDTVTSTDGKINCSSGYCSATYNIGDTVTLNASPAAGTALQWTGTYPAPPPCTGSSTATTCSFVINSTESVQAHTIYSTYNITATKTGSGSGTVSGTGTYNAFSTFNLTATPSANSVFIGWILGDSNICAFSGGKGGSSDQSPINSAPTCSKTVTFDNVSNFPQTLTMIAQFDLKPGYVAPAPATTPKPSPKPSTPVAPTTPPPAAALPVAPLPTIKLGSTVVLSTDKPTITLPSSSSSTMKPLVLSGTTVPNGVVNIYIFSTPQEHTVTADKTGAWSYTVATSILRALPLGAHHIEAEVTDPTTNKTSPRSQVLAFTLAKATTPVTATSTTKPTPTKHTSTLAVIGMVVLGLLVLLALVLGYLWKFQRATFDRVMGVMHLRKRGNDNNSPSDSTPSSTPHNTIPPDYAGPTVG